MHDTFNRPLRDLRISVTDRCNFRCTYCMPLDEYEWLEKSEVLSFEELTRLARLFLSLGVEKIRLTGGEPLARRSLEILIAKLSTLEPTPEICLTTNGSLLAEKIPALKAAGLRRINVSIDSLKPARFRQITKRGDLEKVLDGLFAAQRLGLQPIKINAVIERGVNDDEILDLVAFARAHGFSLRFIEFMDVGNANEWRLDKIVSKQEIIATIQARFPLRQIGRDKGSAPSVDYEFVDGCGGDVGVIASVTEPFCGTCTRARLTADGKFVTCLFAHTGYDLKKLMRGGASDAEVLDVLQTIWGRRKDRYSEERLAALHSQVGYDPKRQKKIEMISLGG
ncbi:MAG: GTP 3',8-cyclase MoaA [Deltaproteobacteria bacterium]|nr:GTP 3',8-cyclase MoaA [Deltaproteobacteria bacterium]